ncbi:MAG: response regulator [Chloroflexota bacterium]|nr:MAG: hypothetical protein DLM70_17435 [Chloroflexota bacterium]
MDASSARVLVIDDEPQIRRLLSLSLTRQGYQVESVATGEGGLDVLTQMPIDIVLLDLGLPDVDGLEVARQIRAWSQVPIIVISVRENERDKIAALNLGADDYVTKPFSIEELLARVRANLRRGPLTAAEAVLTIGSITIDVARRRVTREEREIHLTPTEYDLLCVLAGHAGRVLTHRQLLREARGPAYEEATPLLRVHLAALRQKLGTAPNSPGYIATEPGIGYRLLA